jgi:hypothetical protein
MIQTDYTAKKITTLIQIDGDLRKAPWQQAIWSKHFVEIVTGEPGMYHTQVALLWNDTYLYIAFKAEDNFLEARLTERDSIIFQENDLEVFIEGKDCYYELEVNAANTIYEVFFIWKDAYLNDSRFNNPQFDVHHPQAYTFGGDYDRTAASFWKGTHPRGVRWAFTNFDMPGLQTAVQLDGSLNNHTDTDIGWSLEIAIPWISLQLLDAERTIPPADGDIWNMFLGRYQKLDNNGKELYPHAAMALNSHGVYDSHLSEKWSRIEFVI